MAKPNSPRSVIALSLSTPLTSRLLPALLLGLLPVLSLTSLAHAMQTQGRHEHDGHIHAGRADGHAPIGVMGDHLHHKDGWMFSYRYMRMEMNGNRKGTNDLSPEQIATTEANRFFGITGQPPTLRVVPVEMNTDMHMFGMMYAPNDHITLMGMVPWLEKSMRHVTFQGAAGTTRLGEFTTKTSGLGDIKLSALIGLTESASSSWHAMLGVSLPTGSNTETGTILTPTNARPTVRLPYPMQLGSGTTDLLAGLTWKGHSTHYSWGAQYQATIRTGSDEGYSLGDEHKLSAWGAKLWTAGVSTSVRLSWLQQANIQGQDPNIVAPVQTADPARQGKQRLDLGLGANLLGTEGALKGHRLALEWSVPLYQKLDGPQLKSDWMLTLGYQLAW